MTCLCSKGRWSPDCPVHPPTPVKPSTDDDLIERVERLEQAAATGEDEQTTIGKVT